MQCIHVPTVPAVPTVPTRTHVSTRNPLNQTLAGDVIYSKELLFSHSILGTRSDT